MIREVSKVQKNIEYAIVDIETTGGNASGSRITEIAILIHDGQRVIDRYETLVNPEKEIPLPIFALTGINDEMVRDAPCFGDIASEILKFLENRVFVAHSVNFDYSFIRHQLEEAGYRWTARKLCTVRMARRIRPGLRSYGLGNLCAALDIPICNRHRAGGDADATAILFSRLLEWDQECVIEQMLKHCSSEQRLPPNLPPEQFQALPDQPGVYYFHDRYGKVIYVGKARNVKTRVAQHFSGHNINPQRQHFMRNIFSISFEVCATELMALLLECIEIKRLWPPFNRALKRFEPKHGLFLYEDQAGYKRLAVGRLNRHQQCIQVCNREYDSVKLLRDLISAFSLNHRLCSFGKSSTAFSRTSGMEKPERLPDVEEHNRLVDLALDHLEAEKKTFAVIDKGREPGEKSCIWIEKGHLYAMGYIPADTQLESPEEIRDSLKRYYGNHYMMQLIYSYVEKYPFKVLRVGDQVSPPEY